MGHRPDFLHTVYFRSPPLISHVRGDDQHLGAWNRRADFGRPLVQRFLRASEDRQRYTSEGIGGSCFRADPTRHARFQDNLAAVRRSGAAPPSFWQNLFFKVVTTFAQYFGLKPGRVAYISGVYLNQVTV
jgi:hypothetical protein